MPTPKKPVMEKLSDADKNELVRLALEAASDLDLCEDTNAVLKHMGFEIPSNKKRITLVIETEFENGDSFDEYDWSFKFCSNNSNNFAFSRIAEEGVISLEVENLEES